MLSLIWKCFRGWDSVWGAKQGGVQMQALRAIGHSLVHLWWHRSLRWWSIYHGTEWLYDFKDGLLVCWSFQWAIITWFRPLVTSRFDSCHKNVNSLQISVFPSRFCCATCWLIIHGSYTGTSALIVLSHNDQGVRSLIMKQSSWSF